MQRGAKLVKTYRWDVILSVFMGAGTFRVFRLNIRHSRQHLN